MQCLAIYFLVATSYSLLLVTISIVSQLPAAPIYVWHIIAERAKDLGLEPPRHPAAQSASQPASQPATHTPLC